MGIFQTEDRADRAAAHYGAEGALAARINALQAKVEAYESPAALTCATYPLATTIELWGAPVLASYEMTPDGPAIGRLLINGTPCDAEQVFQSVEKWDAANDQLLLAVQIWGMQ